MNSERDQRLRALFARTHAGIKPGLDLILELLEALGNPHQAFLSVHVAGTNGKGSTCALLESGVRRLGLKSGLFTSPHLVRVNERIRIEGTAVSDDLFYSWLDEVQAVERSLSRLPTFFETLTAMAFLGFKQSGVQIAVIETGMGGRLDCTNVFNPLMSVITRIDMDHMAYLGDTLAKIAGEKAGIIKPGRPVVIGAQAPEAEAVLRQKAVDCGSPMRMATEAVSLSGRKQDLKGQRLTLSGTHADYGRVKFPLLGDFQLENLCTALTALEWLPELLGLSPEEAWIKSAVENVQWAARGQVLSETPPLLLDVAHNPGGALALRCLLQDLFGKKARGVLFWAGLADKDPAGFIRVMKPLISSCICMTLPSPRAMSAEDLEALAKREGVEARVLGLSDARAQAIDLIGEADFGCVAGSVYLAWEWLGTQAPDPGEGTVKTAD